MKTARTVTSAIGPAAALALWLSGCSATQPTQQPPAPNEGKLPPPVAKPTEAPADMSPSLADELKAQGVREARDLERKIGVRLESVTAGTRPTWWTAAIDDPGRAAATQSAGTLPDAFNGAVSRAAAIAEARNVNPRSLRVERASWIRLTTGAYVVWVSLGDGTKAADPAPPIDLLNDEAPPAPKAGPASAPGASAPGASAPAASPSTLSTPPAPPVKPAPQPPAAPDPDAPAWFSEAPSEAGGRTTVGCKAEADTDRDAQRLAFKAGRTQLAGLIGSDPTDLTTVKATTIKLPDGRVRAYALVSCSGTIKK